MFSRLLPKVLLAAVFIAAAGPVLAQVVYDASQGKLPLSLGGGISNFDPDFAQGPGPAYGILFGSGQGRMWGGTAWIDAGIPFGPPWVHGFAAEAEYRSIFAGGSQGQQNLKESSVGGGAIYTWRRWHTFRPYGKYILNFGSIDFTPVPEKNAPPYSHDSRLANSLGGGIEIRCTQHIWARADYEYQYWGRFGGSPVFQPQGVTLGAMYNLMKSPRQ